MKDFWDERYSNDQYAYGENPNEYLREKLKALFKGKILFPADGEGRNSVYAASLGWIASAFDISTEGKKKAINLAFKHKVQIDYQIGQLESLSFSNEQFDVIALIYAHFSAQQKSAIHKSLDKFLKKGGLIIFEAFSKKHIEFNSKNPKVGGPKDLDILFSIDEVKHDFENYEFIELEEKEIELNEGDCHVGKGSVIRFVARKKN